MRHYLTTGNVLWFLVGALLTFTLFSVLGIFPISAHYCTYHEGGYKECASHYLVSYPALWVIDHLEATATVITAFATFYIARFTEHLRNATRAQLTHYRQVERAHVSMLRASTDWHRTDDGIIIGLFVSAIWKNSGTTPATPITAMIGATWVEKIEDFVFGRTSEEGSIRLPFVLGPGAEQPSGVVEIGGAHILGNLEGRGHQFLWGWARYRDIFPGTPEHVVEFCLKVTLTGKLGAPPITPRITLTIYGEHNRYYDERN